MPRGDILRAIESDRKYPFREEMPDVFYKCILIKGTGLRSHQTISSPMRHPVDVLLIHDKQETDENVSLLLFICLFCVYITSFDRQITKCVSCLTRNCLALRRRPTSFFLIFVLSFFSRSISRQSENGGNCSLKHWAFLKTKKKIWKAFADDQYRARNKMNAVELLRRCCGYQQYHTDLL